MLSLSLALFSTLPLDANNCTILTTSSCVNGGGSPLGPLRNASLSCLRRFADATSDFGTRDNERWAEYAPTCAVWDGVPFGVAEPLNAFSSLAYDELVCVANLSFAHTALSQLAFGSFAMHASGNGGENKLWGLTGKLDTVPMRCVSAQLVHGLMAKAGQANLPVVVNGKSYAVDTLASSCAASFSSLIEACNLDTMDASLAVLLASMPTLLENTGRSAWAVHRACLDDPAVGLALLPIPLESLAAVFGLSLTEIAELDSFADALGLVAPGVAVCAQHHLALGSLLEATSFQGSFPGTVEMHHRWHEKTAESLMLQAKVLTLLPDPSLRQPTCSSDDDCQSGRSCLCDDSKDVSRRRRALLFATAPHSCRCQ